MSFDIRGVLKKHTLRSLRLDPDGPLVPMQPAHSFKSEWQEKMDKADREQRDACVVHALRFTWR